MTVADWNLVLNAIVAVALVSYGAWLKYVVEERSKAKDATIDSLRALIERLRTDTAPAIAEQYRRMREFANAMAEEHQKLKEELQQTVARHTNDVEIQSAREIVAEALGLATAQEMLIRKMGSVNPNGDFMDVDKLNEYFDASLKTVGAISSEIASRQQKANQIFKSKGVPEIGETNLGKMIKEKLQRRV